MPDYVSILLLFYIMVREIMAAKERKDLYDRIMSKDLPEFKENTQPEHEAEPEAPTVVDIEDARDELLGEDDEN